MAAKKTTKKPAPRKTPAKKKKPAPKLPLKKRLKLMLTVLVLFCVGAAALLHFTGIMPVSEIFFRLGIYDRPATRADLEVHFIDVGQGDCTLVMSKGEIMVIDSGDRDDSNRVEKYLLEHGVTRINYLIATHPHADHIGEMAEIMGTFTVDNFIMPYVPEDYIPDTKCYEDMLKMASAMGVESSYAEDKSFRLGECDVKMYASGIESSENLNDYSVIVKLVHGSNSFLFTGDCENTEEADLLSRKLDLKAKVLKAGHHGSYTSSSAEFLDEVLPDYAVISCGRNNDYGHPHDATLRRLSKYADNIYITSRDGDVVFISDGKGLSVECAKKAKK
ncbi:ComEC/Rec2 family competence protein [Ruminococcus sp.]|uniref:ComEC/Rec2 family competence protein n=1 Tax=Ruminococcus sp. TaxID=41978 RepID=UPI0025F1F6C6|nr:ComEC/Rec2 family competence protein [Ruminococcus sp.]MBQ8967562.1 MBL fold metallo-hydrolase [Ruminococcus sp.]